jgi:photosystem II stability/assembly factor-like uncharacterized protein
MKKRYMLLALAVLMSTVAQAEIWKQVAYQSESAISGSYFLNPTTGWFVGTGGTIKKSTDGGATWTVIPTAITEDLKAVYFLDENKGFARSNATLYKTEDGFANYTALPITDALTTSSYNDLYFADALNGWALSSSASAAKILRTADGGATWSVVLSHTSNLQCMDFFDGTSGVAGGGGAGKCDLFYTNDGTTWTKATAPTFPAGYTRTDIRGMHMFSKDVVYGIGWGSLVGAQATIHIKSVDGGKTWSYLAQADANKTFDNMYDIYFKDADNGLAIGGGTKSAILLQTQDAGANWVPIEVPCGAQLSDLFGFGDAVIIRTGANGFLSSADFGKSWSNLTPLPTTTLNSIHAVNDNVIYAAGQDGLIMKTVDGGKSWQSFYQRANMVSPNINGIFFVNENVGYTASSYSLAAKTVDGGATWTVVRKDSTSATHTIQAVHFVDENRGCFVGRDGTKIDLTYQTTDGGATLTLQKNLCATALRGVAFYDALKGISVGEKLKAMYTTDGGTTWTASTFNGVPTASAAANLREVTFVNATTAVAVGDKIVLRSTDGGATWNYVEVAGMEHSMTGIASRGDYVWAVGAKSATPKSMGLYRSVDGGLTWTNKSNPSVIDSLSTVYDVTIAPNGTVYVCGVKNIIYATEIFTKAEQATVAPAEFRLEQNYPNPFNPATRISYQTLTRGHVSLVVYDVLGKEVATLVDKVQEAGVYDVQFSARQSSLASGVYFYTLRAGNSVQTRKMLLMQ